MSGFLLRLMSPVMALPDPTSPADFAVTPNAAVLPTM